MLSEALASGIDALTTGWPDNVETNALAASRGQFVDQPPWPTGECAAVKRLEPDFKIIPLGQGFIRTRKEEHTESTRENARISWHYAKQEIFSDLYNIIILDEINNMIYHGLVSVEEVVTVLRERPKRLTVILTGRNAHEKIMEMADMVTEMREIKHHYQRGIKAQKGIEF